MISKIPQALKFALKTCWIILVFLAAGAVMSLLIGLVNVLMAGGRITQPDGAILLNRVILLAIPALGNSVLYTFIYYFINRRVAGRESGYGAFLAQHWFKFFLVVLCYALADYLLGVALRSQFVHFILPLYVLGLLLKFMLVVGQFYAFAFLIGTRENKKERIERARWGLGAFLLFALLLSVVARVAADVLGAIQSQFVVWNDSSRVNFVDIAMGPQETLTSVAVGFAARMVDLLIRYFGIVYVCMFFAGAQEKGIVDADAVRRNRIYKKEQKRIALLLEQFRDLFVTKRQLDDLLAENAPIKLDKPVCVGVEHVVDLLAEYKNGRIDEGAVFEWVAAIGGNESYAYAVANGDRVESALVELRGMGKKGEPLTIEKASSLIQTLKECV